MVKLHRSQVIVRRWQSGQNEIGSPVEVEVSSWNKSAKVENRTGTNQSPYNQTVWSYDYKVWMRYERERQTRSNDTIDYEGVRMKVQNITFEDEDNRKYEVCRCSKVDELPGEDGSTIGYVPAVTSPYIYTAASVTDTFTALAGKRILAAYKDGIRHEIITTGTPVGKQVKIVSGVFTWGVPFDIGEVAEIDFI